MDERTVGGIVAGSLSGSRVNQLGGRYRNGKPLSPEMRRKVIELSLSGVRPCEISRQLKITHGCISKLLSKFFKTGSLVPGHGTAGRPRVITPRIEKHIDRYRKEQPGIFSWEIRERLLRENVCFETSLPSLSSINRLVKSKIKQQASGEPVQDNNEHEQKDRKNNVSKLNLKHTIESILSCSDSNRTPKNHFSYQPVRKSNSYESQRTGEECSNDSAEDYFSDWKVVWTQNKSGENDSTFFSPTRGSLLTSQRIRFTKYQMKSLEKEFELNPYPSHAERETMSKVLDVEEARIRVWFSNRRAKVKRRVSPSPIHSLHYPSTTNKTHHPCTCACNHLNTEPSFSPLHLNAGPSRFFFPPGYRSLNSLS